MDIQKFINELNKAQKERFKQLGYTNDCFFNGDDLAESHTFNAKQKKKYIYIDCYSSGYFMVIRKTMEIFGIKAYGSINLRQFYGKIGEVSGKDVYKLKVGY